MKVRFQRIGAFLLALVLCVGLVAVPASAASAADVQTSNFWDTFFRATNLPYSVYRAVSALLADDTTPETATDSDWRNAYKKYTETLPADGINGSGNLLWSPSLLDMNSTGRIFLRDHLYYPPFPFEPYSTEIQTPLNIFSYKSFATDSYIRIDTVGSSFSFILLDIWNIDFPVPLSGSYRLDSAAWSYRMIDSSGLIKSDSGVVSETKFTHCDSLSPALFYGISSSSCDGSFFTLTLRPPVFEIIPDSSLTEIGDYSVETRVGTITGDFGIMAGDGSIIKSTQNYIVNETTNTYYNPVTDTTAPITDWTYDYSDRSYDLTLESGDTVTVTYGDEYVTIKQGDTINNVYYITEGGGGGGGEVDPSPSPSEHTHDYKATVTTEPSCVGTGVKTYTCSICGDTYTEKVPATGHSWVVDKTVNTTYDENGNVLTQGYTIYKCSVCANEYKDDAGTGPPGGGGGSEGGGILDKLGELLGAIFGGILSVLGGIINSILDALIGIVNGIVERLATVVSALSKVFAEVPVMFSGFTDFLGATFSFLPPEITTILIFGILAVVLVAIVKMFLK